MATKVIVQLPGERDYAVRIGSGVIGSLGRNLREVEGFGLGLSIAKNIADAHKGKILVSSEPGEETVFRVVLP